MRNVFGRRRRHSRRQHETDSWSDLAPHHALPDQNARSHAAQEAHVGLDQRSASWLPRLQLHHRVERRTCPSVSPPFQPVLSK